MNTRSRATLFLMEQLIVIVVFAICAAACVKIFAASYIMAGDARDLSRALLAAESGAECYKSAAGDAGRVAETLGGSLDGAGSVVVYYDESWLVCGESEAAYIMRLVNRPSGEPGPLSCDLSVEKTAGEEIIAFTVAARGERDE